MKNRQKTIVDVIFSADVRKAQIPAVKNEAALRKEDGRAAQPASISEESKEEMKQGRRRVKEERGGRVGRAPDAAEVIQEDLSTFDTEMPTMPDSRDKATVKQEYGAHEATSSTPQKAANSEIQQDQPSAATPPKGEYFDHLAHHFQQIICWVILFQEGLGNPDSA